MLVVARSQLTALHLDLQLYALVCMHTKERVSPRSTRASRTDVQIEGKGAGAGTPVGRYFVQLYSCT